MNTQHSIMQCNAMLQYVLIYQVLAAKCMFKVEDDKLDSPTCKSNFGVLNK
jgi:hypothetical protein